jgi:hypothetical protein
LHDLLGDAEAAQPSLLPAWYSNAA